MGIEATLTKDVILLFIYSYFFSRIDLRNEKYHFIGFSCRQLGIRRLRTKRQGVSGKELPI